MRLCQRSDNSLAFSGKNCKEASVTNRRGFPTPPENIPDSSGSYLSGGIILANINVEIIYSTINDRFAVAGFATNTK